MTYLEAIIIGIVQGITEFLPISSTAHIMIATRLLGLSSPGLALEIFLHLASVIAVMAYFWRDLLTVCRAFTLYPFYRRTADRPGFFLGCYILVATLITGVLGLFFLDQLGDQLRNPYLMGLALWTTAGFLLFIEKGFSFGNRRVEEMKWRDSIFVGLGQTVAVLPGISRSGSTLVVALLCGLERETAVRYSFLLAIPVILGSSVIGLRDANNEWFAEIGLLPLALSFVVCLFASLAGIIWLIGFLRQGRLFYFAIYCFLLGALAMLFLPAELAG